MKQLYLNNPESPFIFQHCVQNGYYYYNTSMQLPLQTPNVGGYHCLLTLPNMPIYDLRRELYSKIINPHTFVSKKEKEEIKSLVDNVNQLNKKMEKYTDENAVVIYNKQSIDNPENIRSLEEIKKSFLLPQQRIGEEIQKNNDDINNRLIDINKRYMKKLDIDIEKYIRDMFKPILDIIRLPVLQVDRLVSIYQGMDNVIRNYIYSNQLFGDELEYYNII